MSYDNLVGKKTSSPSYESYLASYHGMTPPMPMSKEQWERRLKESNPAPPSTVFEDTHTPITATDICTEAARLVGGSRQASHGDRRANFQNIALLWNAYMQLRDKTAEDICLTPLDVGNMMELMKIARRFTGHFNLDDYTDAAGYAACTGEIAASANRS